MDSKPQKSYKDDPDALTKSESTPIRFCGAILDASKGTQDQLNSSGLNATTIKVEGIPFVNVKLPKPTSTEDQAQSEAAKVETPTPKPLDPTPEPKKKGPKILVLKPDAPDASKTPNQATEEKPSLPKPVDPAPASKPLVPEVVKVPELPKPSLVPEPKPEPKPEPPKIVQQPASPQKPKLEEVPRETLILKPPAPAPVEPKPEPKPEPPKKSVLPQFPSPPTHIPAAPAPQQPKLKEPEPQQPNNPLPESVQKLILDTNKPGATTEQLAQILSAHSGKEVHVHIHHHYEEAHKPWLILAGVFVVSQLSLPSWLIPIFLALVASVFLSNPEIKKLLSNTCCPDQTPCQNLKKD